MREPLQLYSATSRHNQDSFSLMPKGWELQVFLSGNLHFRSAILRDFPSNQESPSCTSLVGTYLIISRLNKKLWIEWGEPHVGSRIVKLKRFGNIPLFFFCRGVPLQPRPLWNCFPCTGGSKRWLPDLWCQKQVEAEVSAQCRCHTLRPTRTAGLLQSFSPQDSVSSQLDSAGQPSCRTFPGGILETGWNRPATRLPWGLPLCRSLARPVSELKSGYQ